MQDSDILRVYQHYFRLARGASQLTPPEFGTAVVTSLQTRLAADLANLCRTGWMEQVEDRNAINQVLNQHFASDRPNDELHRWLFTNVMATVKKLADERTVQAWMAANWAPGNEGG